VLIKTIFGVSVHLCTPHVFAFFPMSWQKYSAFPWSPRLWLFFRTSKMPQ